MIHSCCRETPYLKLFYVTREKETAHVQKWRIISISRNRAARDSERLNACFIKITHVYEGNFVHQDSSLRDAPAPACGPRARLMSRVTSERDFERSPCQTADWSTRVNGFSLSASSSLSLSLSLPDDVNDKNRQLSLAELISRARAIAIVLIYEDDFWIFPKRSIFLPINLDIPWPFFRTIFRLRAQDAE